MELFTLIISLLLAISFLLAPTVASYQLNLQKSLQKVDDDHAKLTQLSLPRKLMNLHEEVKGSAERDSISNKKLKEPLKDTTQHEKVTMNAVEKGTWTESVEEEDQKPNKSEYFTMDYGWVRRRRPIHN